MLRMNLVLAVLAAAAWAAPGWASELHGTYLETRTCQVYTGPCFANAEVGMAGKDAIMAWNIEKGAQAGVDLSGLNVVVVVRAEQTLGFQGMRNAGQLRSVVYLDDRADARQRQALLDFARRHAGKAGSEIAGVSVAPIRMTLDLGTLEGEVQAGREVKLTARKARPGDCICSNESAYYPPLAQLENFAPGVTLEGEFRGNGLGSRWSIPGDRSSYLGTFAY